VNETAPLGSFNWIHLRTALPLKDTYNMTDLSKTFHRRELKAPAVQFSSAEGRRIFAEALHEGHMET